MWKHPYYTGPHEIPGVTREVVRDWGFHYDEGTPPEPGDVYKIHTPPSFHEPKWSATMVQENNPEQLASDIRQAPFFYFGGLLHDYIHLIGPPLARIRELIEPERRGAFNDSLAFCPAARRQKRIEAAYQWNADHSFPIDKKEADPSVKEDIEKFAEHVWKHRFCDAKNRLLPSSQFTGFNFVTYSIGGRLAFMVENVLRTKLRQAVRARDEGTMTPAKLKAENELIQMYFDKCKIISIGHAVDWEGESRKVPSIPKTFLVGRDDEGVVYPKSFWDFMHAQDCGGNPAVCVDISAQFHAKPGSHRVVILGDGVLTDVANPRADNLGVKPNSHGLSDYVRALVKHRDNAQIKSFIDEMNACLGPDISRDRAGQISRRG